MTAQPKEEGIAVMISKTQILVGDDILAAVVLKPGETATAQHIAQWCREHLAPQKVPRYVLFVDELPHTPTHKVAKAVLKNDATLKARATDLEATAK